MLNFLSTGQGYADPRQSTMRSLPAREQNAPALTAGTAPVTPRGFVVQGNASAKGFGTDNLIYGRISLGVVAAGVVGLALIYIWTRNVQGGG